MITIGITAGFIHPDMDRDLYGPKTLSFVENDLMQFIARKGIMPLLIPDLSIDVLNDLLDKVDAFVFQGGADIAPETYGASPNVKWTGDPIRDKYELKILDYAIKNSKPVLGISRGAQLLNVYCGGTLFQDITAQNKYTEQHRSAYRYDSVKHAISFNKGKILYDLYKDEKEPHVNSVHHQVINELGDNLDVYAVSPDGFVEAIGYTKEPAGKVMGVQWHPEFSHSIKDQVVNAELLYDAFLEHVKSDVKKSKPKGKRKQEA